MKNNIIAISLVFSSTLFSACQQNNIATESVQTSLKATNKNTFDVKKDFPHLKPEDNLIPVLPKQQWNLIFFDSIDRGFTLNINADQSRITMSLNCSHSNEHPFFLLEDRDGVDVLTSKSDGFGEAEFILDQHSFMNPFQDTNSTQFEKFKTAFYQAKSFTVKIWLSDELSTQQNAKPVLSNEFHFNNRYAELLKTPSPACSTQN